MSNGHCGAPRNSGIEYAGYECPQDLRCPQWDLERQGTRTEPKTAERYDAYTTLDIVLNDAFMQAAQGKGKERHATDNNFEDQLICQLQRVLIGHPFAGVAFQVMKKTREAGRLFDQGKPGAAYAEVCGAINYAAAMGILIKEMGGE